MTIPALQPKSRTMLLAAFILLKFLLQYTLVTPDYDLQRDEYLHLDQANHPAWGYLSVPPLTSWISTIIKWLGNGIFWVKFFPAAFGALTIILVWKAVELLNGNVYALALAATGLLLSSLLRLNMLYQPNSFDVLSWAAVYYFLIRYFKTNAPATLYAAAIAFALGFLNKYNVFFLAAGLLPAILATPQRRIFLDRHLYFSLLLALALVLPNLLWQFGNGFPVIYHMNELASSQLVHVERINFFKSQLLFFTGSLIMIAAGLFSLVYHREFRNYRFMFFAMVFTLAAFVFFRAKDYYAFGIYPIYISFGSVYLERILHERKFLRIVIFCVPLLLFIPLLYVAFPNKSPNAIIANQGTYRNLGLLRWEDGKNHDLPQDFADMLGWRELADKVDSLYSMQADPRHTIIICDNYGQAGAINYYSRVAPRAVSFNADYVNWFDLSVPYKHLIRIKDKREIQEEMINTGALFETAAFADSITAPYAREQGTAILVFNGARIDVNQKIQQEIDTVIAKQRGWQK